MVDTITPYQIVIFTQHHSIAGGLFLHDQRVSDYLNDRRETTITLRNASLARLEEPARILEKALFSVIPKDGIVLAFEPPQKAAPPGRRFIKYPKQKYDVFLATDGMEVHGQLNLPGPLDLRHTITNAAVLFLPITKATVTLQVNPALILKRDTVLVNVQRIRFLGEAEPKTPPEEKP
jgi:hypothetical protein